MGWQKEVEAELEDAWFVTYKAVNIIVLCCLAIAILSSFASAEVSFNSSINKTVNATLRDDNLTFIFEGGQTSYNISSINRSNETFIVSIPIVSSLNVSTFNITVNDNCEDIHKSLLEINSFSCKNEIINSTAYFEKLIRDQLVPSVQNYEFVRAQAGNASQQCAIDKQILIDEGMRKDFEINSTKISCNASMTLVNQRYEEMRADRDTTNVLFYISLTMAGMLLLAYAKGIFFPKWIADWYNDRTGRKLRGVKMQVPDELPPLDEVRKSG